MKKSALFKLVGIVLIAVVAVGYAPAPVATAAFQGITLKEWDIWTPPQDAMQEKLNANFMAKHPGVTIERTGLTLDDMAVQLPRTMTQPDAPCIAEVNQGATAATLIQAGALLDLDTSGYAAKYKWHERISKGLLDNTSYSPDGKTYGSGDLFGIFPTVEVVGVYYNKDIFKANNISVPKTFDELQADLDTLKKAGIVSFELGDSSAQGGSYNGFHYMTSLAHLQSSRAWLDNFVFGVNNASFDDPAIRWGITTYLDWHKKGYFNSEYSGITEQDAVNQVIAGKAAMMLTGSWWAGSFDQAEGSKDTFGFFTLPPVGDHKAYAVGGIGIPYSIGKNCKYPDLAAEYLDYLISQEGEDVMWGAGLTTFPPSAAVTLTPLDKDLGAAFALHNTDDTMGHYLDNAISTGADMATGLQDVVAGNKSVDDYIKGIQQEYVTYLASKK